MILMNWMDLFLAQEPAYNPQVEAISPTLPADEAKPGLQMRSSKDELLQAIGRVDREISKVESQISKLQKKQVRSSYLLL